MPRTIRDDGSSSARIVLVGEMPAAWEEQQNRPFVGPAGMKLAGWWRQLGLNRSDMFITNVIPYRHNPKNDIKLVPYDEVQHWTEQLHDKLASLTDPWLIVPTGNTALRALVGKTGISKHRGSIYAYRDRAGRIVKVVPTIHPAALFRQPGWERRCLADWARIRDDAAFRDLHLPAREHFIRPTLDDCVAFLENARIQAEVLAIDIETPRELSFEQMVAPKTGRIRQKRIKGQRRITCIGFSYDPSFSITIPTTETYWANHGVELVDVWDLIRQLCGLPCEKAGQNFPGFDQWWLLEPQYDVKVKNFRYDCRWMSHCADRLDEHGLAYQASIHTREPYWKDDAKGEDDDSDVDPTDVDLWYRYNGKDACVTRELVDVHHKRLVELGRLDFYDRHYRQMFGPMLRTSRGGIRTDPKARRKRLASLLADCIGFQTRLTELAGEELTGPKGDFSPKKLTKFLYETLRLPVQRDRTSGNLTANEVTVRRLVLRFPDKLREAGSLILDHRRKYTVSKFLREGTTDADGYSRCSYGFVDTLRLRSGKSPRGTGQNHQNIDRELLDLYLPDPGHIFLEVDESQGEDRIVKMYAASITRDPRRKEILFARARSMPWENDEHRRAAGLIFYNDVSSVNVPLSMGDSRVTKEQRYIAKRTRHASNYGERGRRHADELLKEGIVITPEEGDRMIDAILDRDTPEVRDWQRAIRQEVLRDRCLTSSWGDVVDYTYERLNDDLYRRAYAWRPQHELTTIVNQWGYIPLDAYLRARHLPARIALQKHDSLLVSTPPEFAWEIACFLHESLERPRMYMGEKLMIPVEAKLGRNAAMSVEFKQWPSREEFEAAAKEISR